MEILNELQETIYLAGEMMRNDGFKEVLNKTDDANIVTDMDIKVQKFIIDRLSKLIPESKFFAEEKENNVLDEDYTWIIDPIDGTTNFAYDMKHSAISICLAKDKEAIIAFCYNPYLEELFYAIKGEGAYLNGNKISVTDNNFKKSLIMCGTSPYNKEVADKTFNTLKKLFLNGRDIRRSGSAVLDLCYLASGRIDAFYEEKLSFWDYAAASLIVEEANGKFKVLNGNWGDKNAVTVIAGNTNNIIELEENIK